MSRSIPSNAKSEMLVWARTVENLETSAVEKAEKLEPGQLERWEKGDGTPSLAKLRKLAKRYKRPMMVFYLKKPPKEFSVVKLKDFRRLSDGVTAVFSTELRNVIRSATDKQAWASRILSEEEVPEVPEVPIAGSLKRDQVKLSNAKAVADKLRETLGVTISGQSKPENERMSFLYWRERCESQGVLVFQTHLVSREEMQGFALRASGH